MPFDETGSAVAFGNRDFVLAGATIWNDGRSNPDIITATLGQNSVNVRETGNHVVLIAAWGTDAVVAYKRGNNLDVGISLQHALSGFEHGVIRCGTCTS